MNEELPQPVSVEACFLSAVLAELQALRADVQAMRPPEPAELPEAVVELREPKPRRVKK
jgi:hypothetical protein